MWKALPIALISVSCIVLAQDQRSVWTDKNNGQMYAAYMLQITYYERGYMSAEVDVKRRAEQDVFVVNPGPIFHFKDVKIVGVSEPLVQQVMKDAPKAGAVFSAARLSDWIEEAKKQIKAAGVAQKFAGQEVHLDRAAASANVTILFK